jgi:hypothetical protein
MGDLFILYQAVASQGGNVWRGAGGRGPMTGLVHRAGKCAQPFVRLTADFSNDSYTRILCTRPRRILLFLAWRIDQSCVSLCTVYRVLHNRWIRENHITRYKETA